MGKANDRQHGGDHYKKLKIEPWDYVAANGLGYFEGSAVKYLTRWREKGGVEDLRKAVHFIEKLIEHETEKEEPAVPAKVPLPPICVVVDFDPYKDVELSKIFADPFNRTFWLLWQREYRMGHSFNSYVQQLGKNWYEQNRDAVKDFKGWLTRITQFSNVLKPFDVSQFANRYHLYFTEYNFSPFDLVTYRIEEKSFLDLPIC